MLSSWKMRVQQLVDARRALAEAHGRLILVLACLAAQRTQLESAADLESASFNAYMLSVFCAPA